MKKMARILAGFLALCLFAGCSNIKKAAKALDKDDYEALAQIFEKAATMEERDEIIGEAEAKLEGLINQYNTDQITYEAATAVVDSMESTRIVSSYEIEFVRDELQGLQWSKQAYQTGLDYMNQGKYLEAMDFFLMVSPFDTLSDQADDHYAQAQNQYVAACKQQAEAAAAQKDFDTAIQILNACSNNIPDSAAEEIQVLIRKYEADGIGESIAKVLEEANALKVGGDYAGAYGLLQRASAQYPNRVEIESALSACQREYIENAIQRAQNLFDTGKDYNGAISLLSLAMGDFPENPQLQAAMDKYAAYRPVELYQLSTFYEEGGYGFANYKENQTEKDNLGNEYFGYYKGFTGLSVYRINGQYNRLTGIVYVPNDNKSDDDIGRLIIYADGKEVFDSGKMGKGIEPVVFDIDVTGKAELKFETKKGDWDRPHYANIFLIKEAN